MATSEAEARSEIPANQKVTHVPTTVFNHAFAAKASSLKPQIHEWVRHPQRLIRFEKDEGRFFRLRPVNLEESSGGGRLAAASAQHGKNAQFILDFGIHLVGYLSFHVTAHGDNIDAPAAIRLTFGETPRDVAEDLYPCDSWISTSWLPDEVLKIDDFPAKVAMTRRHAFRYVKVHVLDTSPKYKISFTEFQVRTVSSVSPKGQVSLYSFQDPLLEAIDKTCIFTLRDCMQNVFEDGPRRDRRLWIGDLRLQALSCYKTGLGGKEGLDLIKRCLYMFAALVRDDESLPACLFEHGKTGEIIGASDYIVDYDALFGPTVYDYVVASGDLETGRELLPTILGSMKSGLSHISSETGCFDSSLSNKWKFLDWSPSPLDVNAGMHGLIIFACRAINDLADLLQIEQPYTTVLKVLITPATLNSFYDESIQLFISGHEGQISLASAAWLVLSSAFPQSISRVALLNALYHPDAIKPQTPYLYHHVVAALVHCGAHTEALDLIRDYWGSMVELGGCDTFWECFDKTNPRASPYGSDCQNNSFCHAWSCTPAVLLRGDLAAQAGARAQGQVTMEQLDQEKLRGEARSLGTGTWWKD